MDKMFRVLSIDGGGVRGVIPATFLIEIEKRTGKFIHELFDLIAGTSTGGILALGLTTPSDEAGVPRYRAADGMRLYREEGPRIFRKTARRSLSTLNGLLAPKYPAEPMELTLRNYFGKARLHETLTDVVITSYDIEQRAPWFFRSLNARQLPGYDFSLMQVARATTAAPSNFSPLRIKTLDDEQDEQIYTLVDGGVFANNPAMVAYVDALSLYQDHDKVMMVSLGTGRSERKIPYAQAQRWGLFGWALPAIDILKSGANESVDYQMRQVLNQSGTAMDASRYFRFQVRLHDDEDDMDNASQRNLDNLERIARGHILHHEETFNRMCSLLMEGV